jgi:hypothetical protein
MIRAHPFQNVYFNRLAGSNIAATFERDYWGLSYRKGFEHILETDLRDSVVVAVNNEYAGMNNTFILPESNRKRLYFSTLQQNGFKFYIPKINGYLPKKPDYYVTEYRYSKESDKKSAIIGSEQLNLKNEVYAVYVGNLKILGVYKVRD